MHLNAATLAHGMAAQQLCCLRAEFGAPAADSTLLDCSTSKEQHGRSRRTHSLTTGKNNIMIAALVDFKLKAQQVCMV